MGRSVKWGTKNLFLCVKDQFRVVLRMNFLKKLQIIRSRN